MFVVISTSILSHLEFQLKVVRFNLRRSLKGYECESVEIQRDIACGFQLVMRKTRRVYLL